jgi:hypothetical protein
VYLTPRPASLSFSLHPSARLVLSGTCGHRSTCCLHPLLRFNDDLLSHVTIVPLPCLSLDAQQFLVDTLVGTKERPRVGRPAYRRDRFRVSCQPAHTARACPPLDAVRDQCGLACRHLICAVPQLRLSSVGPGNNRHDEAEAGSGNQCAMRERGNSLNCHVGSAKGKVLTREPSVARPVWTAWTCGGESRCRQGRSRHVQM